MSRYLIIKKALIQAQDNLAEAIKQVEKEPHGDTFNEALFAACNLRDTADLLATEFGESKDIDIDGEIDLKNQRILAAGGEE